MEVSLDDLRNVSSLASTLLSIGAVVYAWLTSRSKINATEIRELQADMAAFKIDLAAVEQTLKQMPDKDTVHHLDMKVSQLAGSIGVLGESLKSVERSAQRIETFLLEQAKK